MTSVFIYDCKTKAIILGLETLEENMTFTGETKKMLGIFRKNHHHQTPKRINSRHIRSTFEIITWNFNQSLQFYS